MSVKPHPKDDSGSQKAALLAAFQKGGLQDHLQKEMRVKILDKLNNPHVNTGAAPTLMQRLMTSLVSEDLAVRGYDYTNSVFLPESGFENKLLTKPELLTMLNIKNDQIHKNSQSVLEFLVTRAMPSYQRESLLTTTATQTSSSDIPYSIEDRLSQVQTQFLLQEKQESGSPFFSQPVFRKTLENQIRSQMEREMTRFREFQLDSVRLQEGDKMRQKCEEYKQELQNRYRLKYEDLRRREKKLFDEQQAFRKNFLQTKNNHEDLIKRQADLLDLRKRQVEESGKVNFKEKQLEQEKISRLREQLQDKINEYHSLNTRIREKVDYEVNIVRLAIQKEYQDKQSEMLQRKKQVDQEYYKMMSIKDSVQLIQRENNRLVQENTSLRKQMTELSQQVQQVISQNQELYKRLEAGRDEIQDMVKQVQELQDSTEKHEKKANELHRQLVYTRKLLDQARAKQGPPPKDQDSDDERERVLEVVRGIGPQRDTKNDELTKMLENLKKQRKKDIEKLKLDLLH